MVTMVELFFEILHSSHINLSSFNCSSQNIYTRGESQHTMTTDMETKEMVHISETGTMAGAVIEKYLYR